MVFGVQVVSLLISTLDHGLLDLILRAKRLKHLFSLNELYLLLGALLNDVPIVLRRSAHGPAFLDVLLQHGHGSSLIGELVSKDRQLVLLLGRESSKTRALFESLGTG